MPESRRKGGISLEDSPGLSPAAGALLCIGKGSVCGLVHRDQRGCRAASSLSCKAFSAHFRGAPADSAMILTLQKTFAIRETLNNVSPDFHNLQRDLDQVGQEGCVLVNQSRLTLCHPMDCSTWGSSVHGMLQARILEWVAIPFSKGSFPTRDWTWVAFQENSLLSEPPGKPRKSEGLLLT